MGRPKKEDSPPPSGTVNGEVPKPDFERAARLLRVDVKPAEEKVGEHAQMMSTAYKAIAKDCHVNAAAARLAFRLSKDSEEKTDDFLRSLKGMLKAMKVGIRRDLVDQAEGDEDDDDDDDIIPTLSPTIPKLATLEGASVN